MSQPAQYIKKNRQRLSKKKKVNFWVKEMKKNVQKRKQKRKKNTWGKLQCFKEKDKKTKFSTSSIVKK
jgi:hypothetical protein